jgi:hypothetical protein
VARVVECHGLTPTYPLVGTAQRTAASIARIASTGWVPVMVLMADGNEGAASHPAAEPATLASLPRRGVVGLFR